MMICRSAPLTRFLSLTALLALAACQNGQANRIATPLSVNMLACRSEASLATLHGAGVDFQRAADAELASGRCRRFEQGHSVVNLEIARFVDPASGQTFWIYR